MMLTVWLYVLANKCIDNGSCVNGTCQNVPIEENDRGYICACEPGYIGQDCENSNLQTLNDTLIKWYKILYYNQDETKYLLLDTS